MAERLDESSVLSHSLLLNPQYWHDTSRRYMESALIFWNNGMAEQSLTVAVMAVNAMLRAYCLKVDGKLPAASPSLDDVLISHVQILTGVNVNIELLSKFGYLPGHGMTHQLSQEQARAVLEQIDVYLLRLSPDAAAAGAEPYSLVFAEYRHG
ncbi:hypothetical protein ACFOLF_22500 [Paenibacillus sepulcri]|uniref:HEPN domain-containing protein n=1 Tax=Paenibacillus sepulcri TaxID=359917 RepID=A0ABS7C6K9_9BACL|nr:hypothetical protein [Paenibacillus sepulcri]